MVVLRAVLNQTEFRRIQVNSSEFTSAFGSRRETGISAEITKIHVNSGDFVLDSNMISESEVIKHTLFAM